VKGALKRVSRRAAPAVLALVVAGSALASCDAGLKTHPPQAGVETEALDWSVDPCADFYRFSCGNWARWHGIAADGSYVSRARLVGNGQLNLLVRLVEEDGGGVAHPADPDARKIGDTFNACGRSAAMPVVDAPLLRQQLAAIRQATTLAELSAVVGDLRRVGVGALVWPSVQADPDDATRAVLTIGPSSTGLERTDFLDAGQQRFRDAYRAHVDALVAAAAANDAAGTAENGEVVLRVETALATISPTDEQARDPHASHNPTTFEALMAETPSFDWAGYLAAAQVPAPTAVDVVSPDYLAGLERVLRETPLAELQAYVAWRVLEVAAPSLGSRVAGVEFDFHQHFFYGTARPSPDWWRCFLATQSALGFSLSQPFVAQVFTPSAKVAATDLVESIRRAMGQVLATAPWLDEPTRAEAQTKLAAVLPKIGFPDQWPSVADLPTTPDDDLKNRLALRSFGWRSAVAGLSAPVDRSVWLLSPQVLNAYYSLERNDIVFPAAILQAPFFDPARPAAANYGAIGSVMGHELTHGFDDQGRKYDGDGTLRDWWTPAVEGEFQARAACLVDQYDRYEPVSGHHVNGALTLGENLADVGGLKLAYAAFHTPEGGNGQGAPGFFTPDQQFFISFAQDWCENDRTALVIDALKSDPHPPWQTRINGAVTDVPAFATAFGCGPGAPLAPAVRCEVW
jgi:putative endopeptidase